jgi:ubiquinone/menaquinone biosynthesis C-methylase UbiE
MVQDLSDARSMIQFADNSFDFILFSFNGIDCVPHSDRLQILQEICRVGKPGCHFFFSSHNLQGMAREFNCKTQISLNPLKTYVNLVMLRLLRLFNSSITRDRLKNANHLIILATAKKMTFRDKPVASTVR